MTDKESIRGVAVWKGTLSGKMLYGKSEKIIIYPASDAGICKETGMEKFFLLL